MNPEIHVQTANKTVEECADFVVQKLVDMGYLSLPEVHDAL
ncbi:hypothetical protein D047_3660 [Vibrio parahaemolyticus VPTS-2010_2]|nr:hypothetical protein D047_3660 [Vibrio parahaemolyticus VPTS-2010_2]